MCTCTKTKIMLLFKLNLVLNMLTLNFKSICFTIHPIVNNTNDNHCFNDNFLLKTT